ncbi:CMD domain-containing protein [Falsiroseomonas sp. HC035]|uniref:CMD domain-containing protein n=1 Tax=Falsiroseomonas sp. HC035 TaxID=3390999 RepID=UPI003D316B65
MPDLIDSLLGLAPDSKLGALRRRRPEALRHAEGAHRELLLPEDPGGLSLADRAALALRVARREEDGALAAHYQGLLDAAGGVPEDGARLAALLRYADTVAAAPEETSRADIDGLVALGLSSRDIVAATQLIAFVPYQVRVIAGLRAMLEETVP